MDKVLEVKRMVRTMGYLLAFYIVVVPICQESTVDRVERPAPRTEMDEKILV